MDVFAFVVFDLGFQY